MASLLPNTKLMFLGNDGKPLVGGKIYTFDSGTNTPRATYADAAGSILNTNPIILDSRGEALVFWNGSYRVKLCDSLDNVIWTADNISEINLSYRTGSNGSVIVPYGTTLQRDLVPQLGYLRYNLDLNIFEGYTTSGWLSIAGAAPGNNSDITKLNALTSINGGQIAGLRNAIINGNFGVNQRAVSGTVTLAAGAYGHDRFKAGASGCTYTFATTANVTTLTISAGSLQQVIEGVNLQSGTYTLSWAGTAQGKIGAGSYGASGITGAITGGTNTTIEFGPGTVSKVQLEYGATPSVFEQRPYGLELALCQRYCIQWRGVSGSSGYTTIGTGQVALSTIANVIIPIPVVMRATPVLTFAGTIVVGDGSWGGVVTSIGSCMSQSGGCLWVQMTSAGATYTIGRAVIVNAQNDPSNYLTANAEL